VKARPAVVAVGPAVGSRFLSAAALVRAWHAAVAVDLRAKVPSRVLGWPGQQVIRNRGALDENQRRSNRLVNRRVAPPLGQPRLGHGRNRQALLGVMRGVVEERQPRAGDVLEVDDVERAGALVEIIAEAARIEPEQRADQQPDRRLVRDDQDLPAGMRAHDFDQRRQRARRHRQAALAAARREGVRVLVPLQRFFGELQVDFLAGQLLPMAVGDFLQSVALVDLQLVRRGDDAGRLDRAVQRRGVDHGDVFVGQAQRQAARLPPAFIRELDIGGTGKPVLRRENRCTMPDKKYASGGFGHMEENLGFGQGTRKQCADKNLTSHLPETQLFVLRAIFRRYDQRILMRPSPRYKTMAPTHCLPLFFVSYCPSLANKLLKMFGLITESGYFPSVKVISHYVPLDVNLKTILS